ncbi:MAG: transglycosylase SLT domain-containing protein, partial [Bacteroidota bacterium]
LAILIGITQLPLQAQQVPRRMEYCGIELNFTPEARQKLTELVYQLTNSPRYFNQMVKRANLYMPFIEEAFAAEGVPEDLKFIAIQESGLQASVVSSSDAVGFWQFKAPTGREMGLRIDDLIDERRHILRASLGAAKYFAKANYYYDNWVYAVIAYYEGQSGSLPYTEAEYYGARSMEITAELHWYVLKAIAHKLAYESSLERPIKLDTYLIPQSTQGETNLRILLDRHGLSLESFQEHNPWLLSNRRLPRDGAALSYYVPVTAQRYPGHVQDPVLHPPVAIVDGGGEPIEVSPQILDEPLPPSDEVSSVNSSPGPDPQPLTPDAHQTTHLDDLFFAAFPVKADIHYGKEYIMYDGDNSVVDLSTQHEVRFTKLLEWNGLKAGKDPEPGTIIYLNKPSKALYHIVEPGDDLAKIASRYGSTIR